MQRALDDAHGGDGVLFGRCGWSGQQAVGHTWGGDQASDFWSLRTLVAATLTAAASGYSNWSHDVGGYLGRRLVERCPKELLLRWAEFGCFTPLMQAHGRFEQEAWTYDAETLAVYREQVLLHERLVPYIRAAAATAARCGLPIIRPLALVDPGDRRAFSVADAYGFGPALWVAPVLEEGAREREVPLPHGRWIDFWTGECHEGGGELIAAAPLGRPPVFVRDGSLVVTYPADHVAAGLGDTAENERPLEATLWGRARASGARARDWRTAPACAGDAGELSDHRKATNLPGKGEAKWTGVRVELHFHLLPGVDDGPATTDDSLELARAAVAQGTGTVVATPHVRPDFVTDPWELPARVAELRAVLAAEAIPLTVLCGGEIGHDMVGRLGQAELELLAQGPNERRWLLVEAPFEKIDDSFHAATSELRARGFDVLIAHPERSADAILDDAAGLRREVAAGSLGQLNAQSVTGDHGFEARRAGITLAEQGLVSVAASDAHGPTRPPGLLAAEAQLALSAVGREAATRLTYSSPRRLLARGFPASQKVTARKHGLRVVASGWAGVSGHPPPERQRAGPAPALSLGS